MRMLKEDYFYTEKKFKIKDGLIYTDGYVKLLKQVTKLPFQFGEVGGYFDCSHNELTTLEGAPTSVGWYFSCNDTQIITLEGAPSSVGGDFHCYNNKLTTLEGAPTSVGGIFVCYNNPLISLEGAPKSVGNFAIDWSKDLPMLRLLMYKKIYIYENDQVNRIFQNYLNQPNKKKAILDCQKELIDNGFVGNAGW